MHRHKRSQKTDVSRIKAWIAENPAVNWGKLRAEGLEPMTISRVVNGELKGAPRTLTKRAFCNASGLAESYLFPFDQEEKQIA